MRRRRDVRRAARVRDVHRCDRAGLGGGRIAADPAARPVDHVRHAPRRLPGPRRRWRRRAHSRDRRVDRTRHDLHGLLGDDAHHQSVARRDHDGRASARHRRAEQSHAAAAEGADARRDLSRCRLPDDGRGQREPPGARALGPASRLRSLRGAARGRVGQLRRARAHAALARRRARRPSRVRVAASVRRARAVPTSGRSRATGPRTSTPNVPSSPCRVACRVGPWASAI